MFAFPSRYDEDALISRGWNWEEAQISLHWLMNDSLVDRKSHGSSFEDFRVRNQCERKPLDTSVYHLTQQIKQVSATQQDKKLYWLFIGKTMD